jgi:hypothetical protein
MGAIKLVGLGVALLAEAVERLAARGTHTHTRRHSPEADQVWQHQAEVKPCRVGDLPDGEIGRMMGTAASGSSQESNYRSPPVMQLRIAGAGDQLSIASHRAR